MGFNHDTLLKITDAVTPVIASLGGELIEAEHTKKYGEDHLTLYVYFASGTSLDECERVHYAVSPILDQLNPTADAPYVLNISSPGLDRPFKTQRDYERNYGKAVEVKLFAPLMGKKLYEGTLLSRDTFVTVIEVEKSKQKGTKGKQNAKKQPDKDVPCRQAEVDAPGSPTGEESKSLLKLENTKIAYVRPYVDFNGIL